MKGSSSRFNGNDYQPLNDDRERGDVGRLLVESGDREKGRALVVILSIIALLLFAIFLILLVGVVYMGIHIKQVSETSEYVHDLLKEVKEVNQRLLDGLGDDFDLRSFIQRALPVGIEEKSNLLRDIINGGRSASLITTDVKEFGVIGFLAPFFNQVSLASQAEMAPEVAKSAGKLLNWIAALAMDGSINAAVTNVKETSETVIGVLTSNTTLSIMDRVDTIAKNTVNDKDVRELFGHAKGIFSDVRNVTGRVSGLINSDRFDHVANTIWLGAEYATEGDRLPHLIDTGKEMFSNAGSIVKQGADLQVVSTFNNFTSIFGTFATLMNNSYTEIVRHGLTIKI